MHTHGHMAKSEDRNEPELPCSTNLELRIWHPNCWTLNVTERVDAGLVSNGVYRIGTEVRTRMTAYADKVDVLQELEDEIASSPLTNAVHEIDEVFRPQRFNAAAGNATRELLVHYAAHNSIHDEFVSRGLVPDENIRIKDGKEYWTVVCTESREEIQRKLDRIRTSMDAEIDILAMNSPTNSRDSESSLQKLSQRQRQVFKLARREGYYTWPREVSVAELASDSDISKATFLEHLRKAESKLLGLES